ncbi:MAG: hypothetical protein WDA08_07255 [Weeksellaceae bacterium]
MKKIVLILIPLIFISCQQENKTRQIGELFFETYSKRIEPEKMLSFYSSDFQYRDVVFGSETNDPKVLFQKFYGWNDPNLRYESEHSIIIDEMISNDSSIIAKGKTHSYTYSGKFVPGVNFIIWLKLDENMKVKEQTDWFDYSLEEIIEAHKIKESLEIK